MGAVEQQSGPGGQWPARTAAVSGDLLAGCTTGPSAAVSSVEEPQRSGHSRGQARGGRSKPAVPPARLHHGTLGRPDPRATPQLHTYVGERRLEPGLGTSLTASVNQWGEKAELLPACGMGRTGLQCTPSGTKHGAGEPAKGMRKAAESSAAPGTACLSPRQGLF